MFSTKQNKAESISEWIERVQKFGSKFREIQTLVISRNHSCYDDIAETALQEKSAIFSKNERYKSSNTNSGPKYSNYNKLGHVASRFYLKDGKYARVNHLSVRNENREKNSDNACYNCQGRGHMAKHCKKPKKCLQRQGLIKERNGSNSHSGNEFRPSESSSRPTVPSTQ